jgi:hypothetical protein
MTDISRTEQVLAEFIEAWNAGRRPRVADFLGRLPEGPEREALAADLTTFISLAPTPALSEEALAEVRAEPALRAAVTAWETGSLLPSLRERAGFSRASLAERLVQRFGLAGEQAAERAEGYVERLELPALEPSRLSRRMLDALGELLGASTAVLQGAPVPRTAGALLRADERGADAAFLEDVALLSRAALTPAQPVEQDELDRLFTGGPDA